MDAIESTLTAQVDVRRQGFPDDMGLAASLAHRRGLSGTCKFPLMTAATKVSRLSSSETLANIVVEFAARVANSDDVSSASKKWRHRD